MFKRFKIVIIVIFSVITVICGILIPFSKVNYDSSAYLPADSEAKAGMDLLEKEFGSSGYLLVMVDNIQSTDDINDIIALLDIENVSAIDYVEKEHKVLLQVVLEENDYSLKTQTTVKDIIDILDGGHYKYYMNGQSYLTYYYNTMIKKQLPRIILLLIPFVLLILVIMTSSYMEPVLFIIVIGIAIVMNMGTNIFLSDVSYLTYSTGPILQLALCMDYSIIFLTRYRHYKNRNYEKHEAVGKAWKTSLLPILSSSLTTVAGFVAIMFMKYRIGLDVGLVLSKGVILSLLSVIILLPALILVFDKAMVKTEHKNLLSFFKGKAAKVNGRYNKFLHRARFIIPGLAVLLIGFAFYFQLGLKFDYSDTAATYNIEEIKESRDNIRETFGLNNQVVVLFNKGEDADAFLRRLDDVRHEGVNYITSVYAYTKQYTKEEFLQVLKGYDITENDADMLFYYINAENPEKNTISFKELGQFIKLLGSLKQKSNKAQMQLLLSRFMPVSMDEVGFMYELMGTEEASGLEILAFLNTPYPYEEAAVRFSSLFSAEEIGNAYMVTGCQNLALSDIVSYYYETLDASYDIDGMAALLGDLVDYEELSIIYAMIGSDTVSVSAIIALFTMSYDKAMMKLLLSELDGAKIDGAFMQLEAAGALDDEGKITLYNFSNFLLENYMAFLSAEEQTLLEVMLIKLAGLDVYKQKIVLLEFAYPLMETASGIDVSRFTSFETIDDESITAQFMSDDYERIILTVNLEDDSDVSFAFFKVLKEAVSESFADYHIVSATTTIMAIKDTSGRDYLITLIISVGLIFIIISLSFKSFLIPMILIIVIQGAIFINMAVPALLNERIIFIGYLIVSCIQLGATIDYGILYTDRYLEHRKTKDRITSINHATRDALPTVLTSGLILGIAGIVLAIVSNIPTVAMIGRLIGVGGLISVVMVLFVIPQILYLTDRWFIRKLSK